MPSDKNNILKQLDLFDNQHNNRLAAYEAQVTAILDQARNDAARIAATTKPNQAKVFNFAQFPQTKARIDKLTKGLFSDLANSIKSNVRAEWDAAELKNDDLLRWMNKGQDPTPEMISRYGRKNLTARDAFQNRIVGGLTISDRVWNLTGQFKSEVEAAVDYAITQGIPANKLATEIQKYLKHPDKLFRRVRGADGKLRLSKPAQAFHPGQGVYRSSYKNARRLAATETNIAYRSADHLRWQDMDFILGIEVKLSNNHTLNGVPFRDICDTLAGRYPKDYKFTGWHPLCRCRADPILASQDEFIQAQRDLIEGREPQPYTGTVTQLPERHTGWIDKNAERINRSRSVPYFMTDNAKLITKASQQVTPSSITDQAAKAIEKIQSTSDVLIQEQVTATKSADNRVHALIISKENIIRMNKDFETAIAVDSEGRVIINKKGGKSSVDFTQKEGEILKDSIFTHNHPGGWEAKEGTVGRIGNSFSIADILTSINLDIKEIRAVTPNYTFTMKRPSSGWPDIQQAKRFIEKLNQERLDTYLPRVRTGTTRRDYAEVTHWHSVWRDFAKKYGIEYTKLKTR